jgi:hypothetical protein
MNTVNQPKQNVTKQSNSGPQNVQLCTVTVASLNIHTAPNTEAPIVAWLPQGTVLNFFEVVEGEMVDGNPRWGHSVQNHYYWMGGTNRPQG